MATRPTTPTIRRRRTMSSRLYCTGCTVLAILYCTGFRPGRSSPGVDRSLAGRRVIRCTCATTRRPPLYGNEAYNPDDSTETDYDEAVGSVRVQLYGNEAYESTCHPNIGAPPSLPLRSVQRASPHQPLTSPPVHLLSKKKVVITNSNASWCLGM